MKRPCTFTWCGKPARVLKHTMEHGTREPFFCSVKHAAYWALVHIADQEVWCEKGAHYFIQEYEACPDHPDE